MKPHLFLPILWGCLLCSKSLLWSQEVKELASLKGHSRVVQAVAFHPEGAILAAGSGDFTSGEAKLWNVATGEEIAMLPHAAVVSSLAFSPDGKLLAAGSYDKTVTLWDLAARKKRAVLVHDDLIRWSAWTHAGKTLVSLGAGIETKLTWWDLGAVKPRTTHAVETDIATAAAPDFKTLAIGGGELKAGSVRLRTISENDIRLLGETTSQVISLAWSPDGRTLAAGTIGHIGKGKDVPPQIKLWDAASGQEIASVPATKGLSVYALSYSPNGQILASGHLTSKVILREASTGKERVALTVGGSVHALAFSSNGKMLAAGCSDRTVKVWDVSQVR